MSPRAIPDITRDTRPAPARASSFESGREVGCKACEGSIKHFPARHHHDVEARIRRPDRTDLVSPEEFPRQAFRAIPTHRRAQLPAGGDSQTRVPMDVGNHEHRHESRTDSRSLGVGAFELSSAAHPLAGRQAAAVTHGYRSSATVRRLRPLARRRFRTIRPFLVAIRTRKP